MGAPCVVTGLRPVDRAPHDIVRRVDGSIAIKIARNYSGGEKRNFPGGVKIFKFPCIRACNDKAEIRINAVPIKQFKCTTNLTSKVCLWRERQFELVAKLNLDVGLEGNGRVLT